ncbi:unnamed protein product [Rhizopus stolonifer]
MIKSIFATLLAVAATAVSAQTNIVSITSPLTGTVYTAGQSAIISWINAEVTTISKIVLAQGQPTSLQPVSTIAENVDASTGSYTWNIPSDITPSNDYALELGTSPNVSYTALFTIQAGSGSASSAAVSSAASSVVSSAAEATSAAASDASSAVSSAAEATSAASSTISSVVSSVSEAVTSAASSAASSAAPTASSASSSASNVASSAASAASPAASSESSTSAGFKVVSNQVAAGAVAIAAAAMML